MAAIACLNLVSSTVVTFMTKAFLHVYDGWALLALTTIPAMFNHSDVPVIIPFVSIL